MMMHGLTNPKSASNIRQEYVFEAVEKATISNKSQGIL
jgi:hypothetical protein